VGPSVWLAAELLLGAVVGVLATLVWQRRSSSPQLLTAAFVVILAMGVVPAALLGPRLKESPPRVRVVSVLDEATTQALVQAFTRQSGILCEVDPFAGGTQTTAELILQGRIHPDVLLGGTVEIHQELADAGILLPHPPLTDPQRQVRWDDPEGRWTPLYLGVLGLVYRPLPELEAHDPDWLTLIQPRWKDRVAIPAPDKSGGGLVFLATQILRQNDEAKAWEYLALLDQNQVHWEARSSVPISRVAAGTMDIGVAWAHDVIRRVETERLPVELTIPVDTGYEIGAASILASGPNPDAARRFLEFLASREAAQIQAEVGHRVPLRSDVELPTYLNGSRKGPGEVGAEFDRERLANQRRAWIERWEEGREGA
jgi:iron(III) transport system substrate-binding protein